MGYLNKETITVDAILTKRGRELLAQGNGAFNITRFAVADDEIDYSLYDTAHPLGTQYYGSAIENMPIVEASPNTAQNLKSKLVTITGPTPISNLPIIVSKGGGSQNATTGELDVTIQANQSSTTLKFETLVGMTNSYDIAAGYTAELYDSSIAILGVDLGVTDAPTPAPTGGVQTLIAKEFSITRKPSLATTTSTVILITGNESGATLVVNLTVVPTSTPS